MFQTLSYSYETMCTKYISGCRSSRHNGFQCWCRSDTICSNSHVLDCLLSTRHSVFQLCSRMSIVQPTQSVPTLFQIVSGPPDTVCSSCVPDSLVHPTQCVPTMFQIVSCPPDTMCSNSVSDRLLSTRYSRFQLPCFTQPLIHSTLSLNTYDTPVNHTPERPCGACCCHIGLGWFYCLKPF